MDKGGQDYHINTTPYHIYNALVHVSILGVFRCTLTVLPNHDPSVQHIGRRYCRSCRGGVVGGYFLACRQYETSEQLLRVVVRLEVGVAHGLLSALLRVAVQGLLGHRHLKFGQLQLIH